MGKLTGKPSELKKVNTSLILTSIKNRGTASRAEIAQDTNISHTTVRIILNELCGTKEIISVGLDKSSGGRRAERYKLNSNKRCIIALAIEKNKVLYRVVNIIGEVLEEDSSYIDSLEDVNSILEMIDCILKKYNNIKAIGISAPGVITEEGYLSGKGTEDWKEIKIRKLINERYNIPILLENDLNSTVLSFYDEYTKSNKNNNIAYLSFTTAGAGAGIIANGSLIRGNNGCAGEIGSMPIGNSYLNKLLFSNLSDREYCNIIVNTMRVVTSIINPELIVLGGNSFRRDLMEEILKKYKCNYKISSDIILESEEKKYALLGIAKMTLNLINEEVKLINA